MDSKKDKSLILIRLKQDEDLFKSLEEICRKYKVNFAAVVSGIGMLKDFEIATYDGKDYVRAKKSEPHELCSLQGNIVKNGEDYIFHFHAVLFDHEFKPIGGHLFSAKANITNEIVLVASNINAKRKPELPGIKGLYFK
ncbi:MAG: PPC domain-containing DNA-binding protein [archaeon]